MKTFMDDEFLLQTDMAQDLYRQVAAKQPIFDYHALLSAKDIAENHQYQDLTEAWLAKSPEIWRLLRTAGVPEAYITGTKTTPLEKFQQFAAVMRTAVGSPFYHWTYLMLRRYFGVEDALNEDTAQLIWQHCSEMLQEPEYSIQGLLQKSQVRTLCLEEDLTANLRHYGEIRAQQDFSVKVLPAPCFDKVFDIGNPEWSNYMQYGLGASVDIDISTMQDLREAVHKKLDAFAAEGACTAIHNLPYVCYNPAEEYQLDDIVGRLIQGGKGSAARDEVEKFQTAMLRFLGKEYAKRGWVMQLHYGILKNNNSAMFDRLGADSGFDCVATHNDATGLVCLLDDLAKDDYLPRTVIYPQNPADASVFGTLIGSFEDGTVPGRVQLGLGGQFNHTRISIEAALVNLVNHSLLDTQIGLAADVRTPLIYVQHEYYRRILCDYLGLLVERGEYPADREALATVVRHISYERAAAFFDSSK